MARPVVSVALKIVGLACLGAVFGWIALGRYGNLIFRETIGLGLTLGSLYTVFRDRRDIVRQAKARDPQLVAYAFGIVLFVVIGLLSLQGGARDIANLTRP